MMTTVMNEDDSDGDDGDDGGNTSTIIANMYKEPTMR